MNVGITSASAYHRGLFLRFSEWRVEVCVCVCAFRVNIFVYLRPACVCVCVCKCVLPFTPLCLARTCALGVSRVRCVIFMD